MVVAMLERARRRKPQEVVCSSVPPTATAQQHDTITNTAFFVDTIMQSLRDYVTSFADEQTYERLKQCGDIEDALNECERIRKLVKKSKKKQSELSAAQTTPKISLTDTRAGMRIARFYDWGLSNPRAAEALAAMRSDSVLEVGQEVVRKEAEAASRNQRRPESCSRERHAVWGCRAMAVGCAKELVQLKKCFIEKHNDTNPQYSAYENINDLSNTEACQLDMQKLGQCVAQNWKELDERLKK